LSNEHTNGSEGSSATILIALSVFPSSIFDATKVSGLCVASTRLTRGDHVALLILGFPRSFESVPNQKTGEGLHISDEKVAIQSEK
jgi:hypothetical protein